MHRPERLKLKSRMDSIITDINTNSPSGINRCFMVADDTWPWLTVRGNFLHDGL
jgi:hypothetical protein